MRGDLYGLHARPHDGFEIPPIGAVLTTLKEHRLPSDDVLPPGTTGRVTGIRPPGVPCHGYVGLVVEWEARTRYPGGVVMRWDVVSDPEVFAVVGRGS